MVQLEGMPSELSGTCFLPARLPSFSVGGLHLECVFGWRVNGSTEMLLCLPRGGRLQQLGHSSAATAVLTVRRFFHRMRRTPRSVSHQTADAATSGPRHYGGIRPFCSFRCEALRASPPMDPNTQTPKRGTLLPNGHWWLGCDPKLGCDGPKIDHPHIFLSSNRPRVHDTRLL